MTISWLIDKSALVRLAASPDAHGWATRIERGLVAMSTVTRLEIGFSSRSARDHQRTLELAPIAAMPDEYLTPAIEDRAIAVHRRVAWNTDNAMRAAVKLSLIHI